MGKKILLLFMMVWLSVGVNAHKGSCDATWLGESKTCPPRSRLSKGYFGKDWLGETYGYFAKEISFSNWLRLKTMQSLGIIRMRPRGFI